MIHVELDKVGSTAHVYSLNDLMHAHLYLGSVSCPDVTNRQAVDKWGSTVLDLIKANQPIQLNPITDSFLCPDDYGVGALKTAYCRYFISTH